MIRIFFKKLLLNLLATTVIVFIILSVVGVLYLADTLLGKVGMIGGIVIVILVWIVSISFYDAKTEMKEEKKL